MVTLDEEELANARLMNAIAMAARIIAVANVGITDKVLLSRMQKRADKCAVCPYLRNYELTCAKLPNTVVTDGATNLFITSYMQTALYKCPKRYWTS